jgi:hypothetical protein
MARMMFALGMVLLALAMARNAMDGQRLVKVLSHFRRLRT